MSRWTIPAAWAAASAAATCAPSRTAQPRCRPALGLRPLALDQLHDDEGPAGVLAQVVDGADVRVVQGEAARASRRNRSSGRGSRRHSGQELQGDVPAQAVVAGLVDHPHAAAAQPRLHRVVGDHRAAAPPRAASAVSGTVSSEGQPRAVRRGRGSAAGILPGSAALPSDAGSASSSFSSSRSPRGLLLGRQLTQALLERGPLTRLPGRLEGEAQLRRCAFPRSGTGKLLGVGRS